MKKHLSLLVSALLLSNASFAFTPHQEPLVKQNPPKPNILMVLDTSGSMNAVDMSDAKGNKITRIAALKSTVVNLLARYRYDANIGFTTLGPTGYQEASTTNAMSSVSFNILKMPIQDLSNPNNYESAVNLIKHKFTIPPRTEYRQTPIAFGIYEAAKVFRGEPLLQSIKAERRYRVGLGILSPKYKIIPAEYSFNRVQDSPIQYRCQEQHMILMTDGDPMNDAVGPILSRDKGKLNHNETDYRKVTKLLWNIDLIKDASNLTLKDSANKFWNAKGATRLPIYFNAIGFSGDVSDASSNKLKQAVSYSDGTYVHAYDTKQLNKAFHDIFQSIIQTRSGTGAIQDQQAQSKNSLRYSSSYEPRVWTGAIVARSYNNDTGKFDTIKWDTRDRIKPNQGQFYTAKKGKKKSTGQLEKVALKKADINAQYVNWLQGNEHLDKFRDRQGNTLGAIIHSDLTYMANDIPYVNLSSLSPSVQDEFFNYAMLRRDKMHHNLLIAGTNDGLINFIYADKSSTGNHPRAGERYVSYFPSFFKDDLDKITDFYYNHSYKVDGKTHIFDALHQEVFRTIGITSMGAGAKALVGYQLFEAPRHTERTSRYASGVSSEFQINFEITNQTKGFENLGYTYSEIDFFNQKTPVENRAVAVFGNGFGNQVSSIFLIDAVTGQKINEIILSDEGLGAASPALVVDRDPDTGFQILSELYVGDYSGDLYKLSFNPASMDFSDVKKVKLFSTGSSDQPITVRPIINRDKSETMWLYFGSGSAMTLDDIAKEALNVTHYFYGIKDLNEQIKKDDLLKQEITKVEGNGERKALYTSMNGDRPAEKGRSISLSHPRNAAGERVIFPAVFIGNKYLSLATWSIIPGAKNDPCLADKSTGSKMYLDLYNGNAGKIIVKTDKNGKKVTDNDGNRILEDNNGSHLEDDAYGRPTGDYVTAHNIYGGSYTHNPVYNRDQRTGQSRISKRFESTVKMEHFNTLLLTKEYHEQEILGAQSDTEKGNTETDLLSLFDIYSGEELRNHSGRLYIKSRL